MYKFKYREIHNTLTDKLTVVHVRMFINFLTCELSSSTLREKVIILKSLSYYTMLPKLKHSAHLVKFKIFHFRWSGPEKLNRMPQRSKPKLLNTMVGTN